MRLSISLFLASVMVLSAPAANAEQQSNTSGERSSNVMKSLRKLSDEQPDTMRVLFNKAKNPSMTLSSQHSDSLQKYGLLNADGEIPSHVQNVLLSNVDEDEDSGDLYINGPSDNYDYEENYYPSEGSYYQSEGYYPEGGDYYYHGDRHWNDRRWHDGDRHWDRRGDHHRHHRGDHHGDRHRGDHHGQRHHSGHHEHHGGGHRR